MSGFVPPEKTSPTLYVLVASTRSVHAHDAIALATAATVKAGDEITLRDGSKAAVTKVHTAWAQGLYNPHTMHGDIVVNGVQTSTYTQGIAPALAHAALWPVRAMYAAGLAITDANTFAAGSQLLADALPNGQAKY